MEKLAIKVNLQALKGAFLTNLAGKSATKRCLCIPVDDANLFVGMKGTYLDLTAIELSEHKYDDTHCIKQNLPKDVYEKLSDDDKKAQPIIGGLHPIKGQQQVVETTTQAADDDLPF